jgi:methylmalonyl-CoA/ethylmalonyl-CoA epimerase
LIRKLNHIGLSVRNIEKARSLFTNVFNLDFPDPNIRQDLKSSFLKMGDALFEVIEPRTEESIKALEERGDGISHLCFEVDNIEEDVKAYTAKGLRLKGNGIRKIPGRKVAFFEPEDTLGIVIQLVQFEADRTGSPY